MRNTEDSGKTACRTRFRSSADARSRPNGFSTITRAPALQPEEPRPWTTTSNRLGGIAR